MHTICINWFNFVMEGYSIIIMLFAISVNAEGNVLIKLCFLAKYIKEEALLKSIVGI